MTRILKNNYLKVSVRNTLKTPINKVSAVIITYNEANNLRRTLPQLYWCDEIILVDSFSSDKTISIAKEFHCKIIQRPFYGFGEQKSFAIKQAKNDWILSLDADEFLTGKLIGEICNELNNPGEILAYALRSNLVFRNQRFRFGNESSRYVLRLFNRNYGFMCLDKVHEKIHVEGRIKRLNNHLLHYSYQNISQFMSKFDLYTEWCAEKYFQKGKRKSKFFISVSIPFYFLKYYILDRNILNGFNGLIWSALTSFYHFLKYIKLEDMYIKDNIQSAIHENKSTGFYRHGNV